MQLRRQMHAGSATTIFSELSCLSRPRPNGSRALERAVGVVQAWLEAEGAAVQAHRFTLRPYFMEILGLWLGLAGVSLLLAALAGWGWASLLLAGLTVAIPLLEIRYLRPTLTALVRQPACNLIVPFSAPRACQEVILCAHLDSKTELMDHAQREALVRLGRPAMGLALAGGVLAAAASVVPGGAPRVIIHGLAILATLPVAVYGLGMGANLAGGRLSRNPSSGAVDNGAAVTVLLALASRLCRQDLRLEQTAVTLLFTVGEEAQMQGALAYVRDRQDWPLPTCAVNLEVVGQNGGYLLWEQDGTAMVRLPVDTDLLLALQEAVEAATGEHPARAPLISSDAFAFLQRGIPAATLGSRDAESGERGFHSAQDHADRVDPERLDGTVEVLGRFLASLDAWAA